MAVKLGDLSAKTRTVTVSYEGETVAVDYLPGRVTMAVQARMDAAQSMSAGTANQELTSVLTEILAGWDILDEDGERLPVTADLVRQLPVTFLAALTMAIFEDLRPNAPTGRR